MAEQNQSGDNIFTVMKITIPIIILAILLVGGWITNFSFGGKLTEPEVKVSTSPIIVDSDSIKIKNVEHSEAKTVNNDVTYNEDEVFNDTEWLNGKWELVIYSDKCNNNVSYVLET